VHGCIQDSRDNISWGHLITSRDYSDKYWAFRNCIAEEMVARNGAKKDVAEELIKQVWIYYMQISLQRWYGQRVSPPSNRHPLVVHGLGLLRNLPVVGKIYHTLRRRTHEWIPHEDVLFAGRYDDEIDFLKAHVLEYAPKVHAARAA
jgi:hypothetical protein